LPAESDSPNEASVLSAEADSSRSRVKIVGLVAGIACATLFAVGPGVGWMLVEGRPALNAVAGVTLLMALWWLTEAVPMAVTGLVPLVLFPLLRVMPAKQVAVSYGSDLLLLFLGGFLVALGIEESGLHRRLALRIVATVGDSPRRLLLGFMAASAALSMWLSNTATTVMLLPIAMSVLAAGVSRRDESGSARRTPIGAALMLGIAYAASIGGFATLIGTPTNVAFRGLYEEAFAAPPEISFGGWMLVALPLSVVMLAVAWAVIAFVTIRFSNQRLLGGPSTIRQQLADLGPMRTSERRMAIVFATTAALWIFRQPLAGVGWASWLGVSQYATDATVAITMAVVCFVIPARRWRGPALLGWECTGRVPWGILLLFGGGLALADGMKTSGLDVYLGERLGSELVGMQPSMAATLTSLAMTFLTELTSNVACVNMSMPVLATTAQTAGCDPRLLMIPATLAASCAFMLPVATPPNAIVYGSGQVRVADMIRTGLVLNLLGPPLIVACVILLGGPILGITLDGLPGWAAPGADIPQTSHENVAPSPLTMSVDPTAKIRHNAQTLGVSDDELAPRANLPDLQNGTYAKGSKVGGDPVGSVNDPSRIDGNNTHVDRFDTRVTEDKVPLPGVATCMRSLEGGLFVAVAGYP
jgi:sodium-dependent dicarboxylate transporter 2/3/5